MLPPILQPQPIVDDGSSPHLLVHEVLSLQLSGDSTVGGDDDDNASSSSRREDSYVHTGTSGLSLTFIVVLLYNYCSSYTSLFVGRSTLLPPISHHVRDRGPSSSSSSSFPESASVSILDSAEGMSRDRTIGELKQQIQFLSNVLSNAKEEISFACYF